MLKKPNQTSFKKGHIPWHKGTKNLVKPNKGSFKKGISVSPNTQFKKGSKINFGRKHSKETKLKIALNRRGKTVGSNNPNWKGGKTKERTRIMSSFEYKLWRRSVFERDNYTCIWCGIKGSQKGGYLEADHIKRFADYPELRFAIDNGRTLCRECHKKTDTYGRRK